MRMRNYIFCEAVGIDKINEISSVCIVIDTIKFELAIVFPYTLESSRVTITATVSKISLDINVIPVKIG